MFQAAKIGMRLKADSKFNTSNTVLFLSAVFFYEKNFQRLKILLTFWSSEFIIKAQLGG